jgi:hypothetical protein
MFGASIAMLSACAPFPYTEAPLATNFATTKQAKLQAGHHWQVIANDTADTLAAALAKGGTCIKSQNCPSLHIQSAPGSAFGRAFNSQFVSRLVNQGQSVATGPSGDVSVAIEAQTVRFAGNRSQYMGVGKFTMLGAGIWGLHDLTSHSGANHAGAAAGMAVAITGDVLEYNMAEFAKGPTPEIELILTVSAMKGGQYLARSTNIYYIADSDATLYCWKAETCALTPPPPPPATLGVVGDCGPAPCVITGADARRGVMK